LCNTVEVNSLTTVHYFWDISVLRVAQNGAGLSDAFGSFGDDRSSSTLWHPTMFVDLHSDFAASPNAGFRVQQSEILTAFAVE
jgi:hypothetical protein